MWLRCWASALSVLGVGLAGTLYGCSDDAQGFSTAPPRPVKPQLENPDAALPDVFDASQMGVVEAGQGPDTASRDQTAPTCEPASGQQPLQLTSITTGLERPLYVTAAPGDNSRLFVLEQAGRIRVVENGQLLAEPFLDVTERVITFAVEDGLLGLAFHPEYAQNGRFYVHYSTEQVGSLPIDPDAGDGSALPAPGDSGDGDASLHSDAAVAGVYIPGGASVIGEFRRSLDDPNRANPSSERRVLVVEQRATNHNGGNLVFGPHDGLLYLGMGDGDGIGDVNREAQNLSTLTGKLLRIDVDGSGEGREYGIPAGNMTGEGVRPEIWSYGLRNPWRFSFDPCTNDLYIGDVGQYGMEEIDFEPANRGGSNYGWPITEATLCYGSVQGCDISGFTMPVAVYRRDQSCAVISGHVYRGHNIPALRGTYLYADYCSGRIDSFRMQAGVATEQQELTRDLNTTGIKSITSFGVDNVGEVYVVSQSGTLYRIDPE